MPLPYLGDGVFDPEAITAMTAAFERVRSTLQLADRTDPQFMTLLGGATAWPLAARAQQGTLPLVGVLNGGSADDSAERVRAFRAGLGTTGTVEGQTVTTGSATAVRPGLSATSVC